MNKQCKIIAIASQKGGVGKSTTCRNLASILVKQGLKVLSVDCDNQGSMTDCFGINNPEELEITLYHLMMDIISDIDLPPKDKYIIQKEGIDIIPSSIELSAIEMNLVSTISREYVLKTIIDEHKNDYDYIGLIEEFDIELFRKTVQRIIVTDKTTFMIELLVGTFIEVKLLNDMKFLIKNRTCV